MAFYLRRLGWYRLGTLAASTAAIAVGLITPAFAADPFRTESPHAIGDQTEAAFIALFKQGDYVEAQTHLDAAKQTEADEPLLHAMLASLAYLDEDWDALERQAALTQSTAQPLISSDPLRGHLYTAVGIFMDGAHMLKQQGIARGTPRALTMLQQVFRHLDQAEAIDPNDPELSLIKGYMDLMLAVNLPFSNPEQAITRLSSYGAPVYLAQRGIALGYRDLGQVDNALTAVDQALQAAPENPELFYLKAQLLRRQGENTLSLALFDQALQYQAQLPARVARRIGWERCKTEGTAAEECSARVGY